MMRFRPSLIRLLFCLGAFFHFSAPAHGLVLLEDTVWEGDVLLEDNIVVPRGVTLTVRPGARVGVIAADSTRTDPEYMSSLTEITVRGTLNIEGRPDNGVAFRLREESGEPGQTWAGIIIDGGSAVLRFCTIENAETGIWVLGGTVDISGSTLTANRYGLVVHNRESVVKVADSRISGNDYGLVVLNGAEVNRRNTTVAENEKKDIHAPEAGEFDGRLPSYEAAPAGSRREVGDEVLQGDAVWQGHILVSGRVRVPAGSRLIILPGTVVEFTSRDSNGDSIGENGLMLQGVLIAKGTAENPIVFRSAAKNAGKGSWDAVNIMNSDGARNIIEYCQFEDAYRGLHFHFSHVAVHNSVFRNNYRGIQFQESTVDLRGNVFYHNTSAVQARDSEIAFTGNQLLGNVFGANFFRTRLTAEANRFSHNLDFGLKIREGFPAVTGNIFDHNRFGVMFSDASYGAVTGNLLLQNGEAGLSIRAGDNMEISGNFIQANGLSGLALRDAAAVIRDNHIAANGERGIGVVAFQGEITGNTFSDTRLYAIGVEDGQDVTAPLNWFGQDEIEPLIYDQEDDPARGRVHYDPAAEEPPPFQWPLADIPLDLDWSGTIIVPTAVSVPLGTTLGIRPGSVVRFGKDAGMNVRGRLLALGTMDRRITFTAAEGDKPGTWGEILVEYSDGSRFANCDVHFAAWGIHSHFSPLSITGCSFSGNEGGIRFRSGPLRVGNSLFRDNGIGIRAFRGTAEISNNIITANNKGIFVREQGGGLTITGNNIFANNDYNVWVGDFNREDIRAGGNWWGIGDPEETFFDGRREPGIGMVLYDPPLEQPLEISVADEVQ